MSALKATLACDGPVSPPSKPSKPNATSSAPRWSD